MSVLDNALLVRAAPLLSLVAAAWVVARLAVHDAPVFGLPRSAIVGLTLPVFVVALAAARLVAMIPYWRTLLAHPFDLARVTGERSVAGGAIGAAGALALLSWRERLPFARVADLFGTVLPVGTTVYGLGCVARGDCYGRIAPRPFGIVFSGLHAPRYPVELYAAALGLLIAGGLQAMRDRLPAGGLALAAVGALAGSRALLDHFRLQATTNTFSRDQLTSLGIALVATGSLVVVQWSRPNAVSAPERRPRPAAQG